MKAESVIGIPDNCMLYTLRTFQEIAYKFAWGIIAQVLQSMEFVTAILGCCQLLIFKQNLF